MSVAGGGEGWVPCLVSWGRVGKGEGGGKRRGYPRTNSSWVIVTWGPSLIRMTDTHLLKHYLPTTSFAGGNKLSEETSLGWLLVQTLEKP